MTFRTGGAEQRHQARRLEPFALAPADYQPEVGENEQDETVQKRHARRTVIEPQQRGADALGEQQAGGAADERAEQVRDRRVAQLPLEDHGQQRQPDPERHVDRNVAAKRLQHERRVRNRPDKREARDDEPGHMKLPER